MKKLSLLILLFMIPLVLAQPKLELRHMGYGKTPQELLLRLSNTGNVSLTNIGIYVDDEKTGMIQTKLSPNKSIEYTLWLTPGEHLIEARTPEGAYDSFNITIPTMHERTTSPRPEQTIPFLEKNKIRIIIGMFIILLGIVVWVLTRRPRLY